VAEDLESVEQRLLTGPAGAQWRKFGVKKRAGVCVPLFSLRSGRGLGIGDIGDLRSLVDWCVRIGASVIQILPINDMGLDSVPYSALSAYALDPVFLAVDGIPCVAADTALMGRLRTLADELNRSPAVDYQRVRREKMALLEEAFHNEDGPTLERALGRFREANPWLEDYLPYRVIKELEGFQSWEVWTARYSHPDSMRRFCEEHAARLRFHLYLQYHLDRQLREAREYASANSVLFKGDIPILVARDSADVWRHPEYFFLDTAAGAPPDMYAEDGQYWGFPTYDWGRLAHDDYGWWRARLRQAERYFDLYRIDHVVGFFRIWTIRLGEKTGKSGWFVPAEEWTWGDHGRRLLTMMLDSCGMLPLAEDLGTIPHVCRHTLADLGICGLKVQRWEKRWEQDRRFIPPEDYPALSVATLSTHDSETLSGWWVLYPQETAELCELFGLPVCPSPRLDPATHKAVLSRMSRSGSLFSIFMLQDLLEPFGLLRGTPAENRINVPGKVLSTNWVWRMPVTLEALLKDERGVEAELQCLLRRPST